MSEALLQQILESITDIKKDISGLKSDMTDVKSDISGLKSDVTDLKSGHQRIESKLDAVVSQTADLAEFRTEANEKLDILIEDSKSIQGIIGEHEISIRTLKRKPV